MAMNNSLKGIGVSPGVSVGPIRKVINEISTDVIAASPREIFEALIKVGEDLEQEIGRAHSELQSH